MSAASGDENQRMGLATDAAEAARIGQQWHASGPTVIVVNTDRFFLTHRASWAVAMSAAGSEVTVIAGDTGHGDRIRQLGLEFIGLDLGRESLKPIDAIRASIRLTSLLVRRRPARVLLVATAAYTLGWPAALLLFRSSFLLVVTGAGRVMDPSFSRTRAAVLVRNALKLSRRLPNVRTLFQLSSDRDAFVEAGLASRSRSTVIAGTGIDLSVWTPATTRTPGPFRVLFAARLFKEKGIEQFVELAQRMQSPDLRFVVAGAPDTGVSSSVRPEALREWQRQNVIDYVGQVDDMLSLYQTADLFLFPSLHPEGTPRVLIEAMACGVPIVASDQAGCRAVAGTDGGIIVDPRSVDELEAAVRRVVVNKQLRERLSHAARQRIETEFSLSAVLERLLTLLGAVPRAINTPSTSSKNSH